MPLLRGTVSPDAIYRGANPVDRVYRGANLVWEPPDTTPPITLGQTSTDYVSANVNTTDVTLPDDWDSPGAFVLLYIHRNSGNPTPTSPGVTFTELGAIGSHGVYRVQSPTQTFTITLPTTNLVRWTAVTAFNVTHTLFTATSGSSTTSTVEAAPIGHQPADGSEVLLVAGGTNASAVWTGPAGYDLVRLEENGNATLGIWLTHLTAPDEVTIPPDMDRGNDGTTRAETASSLILAQRDMTPDASILPVP